MNHILRFERQMELSCPLGTTRRDPQEKFPRLPYNKSFIDQVCSVKMAGYWPCSFFTSLWTSTPSRSINTQKKNLANIQPSWPHAFPPLWWMVNARLWEGKTKVFLFEPETMRHFTSSIASPRIQSAFMRDRHVQILRRSDIMSENKQRIR